MLGNFLNGTGYQGGAFGIKISSINKLVDTKGSKDNTTLLHFLVDIVESKFPRIYGFFDDLKGTDAACKGEYPVIVAISMIRSFILIWRT
jgi:cytokinesis protein